MNETWKSGEMFIYENQIRQIVSRDAIYNKTIDGKEYAVVDVWDNVMSSYYPNIEDLIALYKKYSSFRKIKTVKIEEGK